jgi:hypothetical protein
MKNVVGHTCTKFSDTPMKIYYENISHQINVIRYFKPKGSLVDYFDKSI